MKRHRDHGSSYKENVQWGSLVSEVQSIVIIVGQGGTQEDMVLGKLRVLHLDMQATGSDLRYWAWLEHI